MADFEPVAGYVAVESLEEQETETQSPGRELEMCQVVAVTTGMPPRFKRGDVVWVRGEEYHYAPRMKDGTLFVCEGAIIAIGT